MTSFKQKYPAFAALLVIVGLLAQDFAAPGVTLVQKLTNLYNVVPAVMAFVPQIGALGAEISALKSSPTDIEAGGEVLVTDLGFSSAKGVAVIAAAFPVGEGVVALWSPIQNLISVAKAA